MNPLSAWNMSLGYKSSGVFSFSISYGGETFKANFRATKSLFDFYTKAKKQTNQPAISDANDYVKVSKASNSVLETKGGNDLVFVINKAASMNVLLGDGNDVAIGGILADTMYGGAGNDVLLGNKGNDLLFGDAGNDQLQGGEGHDTLSGGLGRDTLNGGIGEDLLDPGGGNDVLTGGDGADVFKFTWDSTATAAEVDTITDFNYQPGTISSDKIDLTAILQVNPSTSYQLLNDGNGKTMIGIDTNELPSFEMKILLKNIVFDTANDAALRALISS